MRKTAVNYMVLFFAFFTFIVISFIQLPKFVIIKLDSQIDSFLIEVTAPTALVLVIVSCVLFIFDILFVRGVLFDFKDLIFNNRETRQRLKEEKEKNNLIEMELATIRAEIELIRINDSKNNANE